MNSIKQIRNYTIIASVILFSQVAIAEDRIPEILARVAEAEAKGSEDSCVILLREIATIDNQELTSFGAGLGPTTQESILFAAVQLLWTKVSAVKSKPLPNDPVWLRLILDREMDEENMIKALKNNSPVTRLAAIINVKRSANISEQVKKALKAIAIADTYMQIERRTLPRVDDRPVSPGQTENIIVAPLRQLAVKELTQRRVSIDHNIQPTDDESARWIAELNVVGKLTVGDIQFAITQLSANGTRIKELKEVASSENTQTFEQVRRKYREEFNK